MFKIWKTHIFSKRAFSSLIEIHQISDFFFSLEESFSTRGLVMIAFKIHIRTPVFLLVMVKLDKE